ncbi:MAG TPA: YtxH domain-containing protein [Candidatus Saccharimonadales bacterium]|nr:YtxH domain-containing protein [Candidatus Saccharimonadales bacterium]
MAKDTAKKFAVGTVLAAAAGYLAGILTAPKSGKETRKDIKDAAVHTYSEAEKQLKKLHTELGQLLTQVKGQATDLKGKAREDLDKAMESAKSIKEKARELLSGLHEGDADNKDLKAAIDEATKAVEHLRSFLAK